ncbi:MAG: hypothetical protein LIQ31_14715 [Planctomycetes bacterium]|nr:hypothetical protein [Planctomycetota bacterium]
MAIQASTGLVSGLDTASIVEALMQVQKTSYNRVSEKLRLEAYQSVNGMLSSLKTSVSNLNSSALWNAKATTSSNESSLAASATQYAVEGSYSLRVAQLATTTQYMTKGYSSQTSAVIPSGSTQKTGTITLESSKARVDNSVKLEELNGGNGVFRGSVRITDASGSSCVVDLSACKSRDEVINELNGAAGIQIEASVGEDGSSIKIVDDTGVSGTMKIQNVGLGTTAADLGIAGSSTLNADGVTVMDGSSIYYMGSNTALTSLRDGLGIEQGSICITVKGASGSVDVYVDLSEAETVSDVLNSTNAALKETAAGDAAADLIGNLKLAINDDANGFTFTGGQVGNTYTVAPPCTKPIHPGTCS